MDTRTSPMNFQTGLPRFASASAMVAAWHPREPVYGLYPHRLAAAYKRFQSGFGGHVLYAVKVPRRDGQVLGTAAYMSPEQARGQSVDKRCDIWAFGCVVFEMLTGAPVFGGPTVSDIVVAVLEHEPDWKALPPNVPPKTLICSPPRQATPTRSRLRANA